MRAHLLTAAGATLAIIAQACGLDKPSTLLRFALALQRSKINVGFMPGRKKQKARVRFILNREPVEVAFASSKTLLEVLREDLGLTGTKHGCELGECGTCTVLLDGKPVLSCLVLGLDVEGRQVMTVEGMADGPRLHPLQEAFAELGAAQCGYCTPGFLLAAKELLERKPCPTREEIKEALSGNLCRCTGYIKIYEAVELAAARMRGEEAEPARESLFGCE
jgi:aerobic-type carbon monoxide dehydrogenase small subunit (CoxS/CutS family)